MGHPGRPRRRNKIPSTSVYQSTPLQQKLQKPQHITPPQTKIKEEPGVQLHDEADLISFRTDALNRFTTNQEYLENVASKFIHSSKIIPPSLYVQVPRDENKEVSLASDQLVFGDLEGMKKLVESQAKELQSLEELPYMLDDKGYTFQRDSTERLAALQSGVGDKESFERLESGVREINGEYREQFKQKSSVIRSYNKYSVPITDISADINVTSAPESYNPRSINSFISMVPTKEEAEANQNELLDSNSFAEPNGMFMEQFAGSNGADEYNQNPAIVGNFSMNMVDAAGMENRSQLNQSASSSANPSSSNINKDQSAIVEDEINQLLQNENNNDLNANDQDIVNDDMGELINFQGDGDDDVLMDGEAFDQDFLSQIDHSME